ncbi:hypothetical protein [Spongiactinospora sp. TRM90649]|uniref:hypothetical protein n=1 Tax=Spongiactinospora sp. TRM90649 TaxID=3031114 RepID=UPI0023F9CF0B|nr:hypothetical protein [Spongiactinospora sp. TRM90649]MDF5756974.1 hypothetical protein [Spongiactinospora sp. TRM90649]
MRALVAIAQKFDAEGRTKDAQTAITDATRLYGEFVTLNPLNGPSLAPIVIAALSGMGVDFSVSEADLRAWLADPVYTPYPAISQGDGRRRPSDGGGGGEVRGVG